MGQHILLQIAAASKTIVECAVKVNNTCATYRYISESADKVMMPPPLRHTPDVTHHTLRTHTPPPPQPLATT